MDVDTKSGLFFWNVEPNIGENDESLKFPNSRFCRCF
jgi:hypothetical protein